MDTNATQLTGLAAYGLAAAACLRCATPRGGPGPTPWRAVGLVYAGLATDVALDLRHRLHELGSGWLRDAGAYGQRSVLQVSLLLALVVLASVLIWRWRSRRMRRVPWSSCAAMLGAALAVLACLLEVVSLHAVDRWLHRPVGPILGVGWIWVVSAGLTVAGALACRAQRDAGAGALP